MAGRRKRKTSLASTWQSFQPGATTWVFFYSYRAGMDIFAFECEDNWEVARKQATKIFWNKTGYTGIDPFDEETSGEFILERLKDILVSAEEIKKNAHRGVEARSRV